MDHQEHNLDWFPRMRAMSLVSSDAEGEQNEIRNLQEKLESTMRLVANLSGQLTELKEQVRHVTGSHTRRRSSWFGLSFASFWTGCCSSPLLTTCTLTFNEQRHCESVWGLVAYSGVSTQTLVYYFISLFLEEFLSLKINTLTFPIFPCLREAPASNQSKISSNKDQKQAQTRLLLSAGRKTGLPHSWRSLLPIRLHLKKTGVNLSNCGFLDSCVYFLEARILTRIT